ncbi:hypothetical protein AAK899_02140 [Erysipelotrichaceae bacterium 51-3]
MNKSKLIEQKFDQDLVPDPPHKGASASTQGRSSENKPGNAIDISAQKALQSKDKKEKSARSSAAPRKTEKKQKRNRKTSPGHSSHLLPSSPRDIFAKDINHQVYDVRFLMNKPLSLAQLESYSPAYARAAYEKDGCQIKDVVLIILTNQQRWNDTGEEIFNGEPVVNMERFQVYQEENSLEIVPNSHFKVCLVNVLYDGDDERGDLMRALRRSSLEEIQNCRIH